MQNTLNDYEVNFKQLLLTLRVVDSKNRQTKLGKCIDYELNDLMQSINEHYKGGKLTITFDISIAEKNELNIQAEVKTTKPKGKKPNNPYFMDAKGKLYIDDPNQMKLISNVYELSNNKTKGENNA